MKVKELIAKLSETGMDNEVRLINAFPEDGGGDYSPDIYLSFDDVGDVVIYNE